MTTTDAVLSGIGMHQVQPDSMQITVNAYLFPWGLGGWNSPIKSIDIKSMGAPGAWKVPLLYFGDAELGFLHIVHLLTYRNTSGLRPFQ